MTFHQQARHSTLTPISASIGIPNSLSISSDPVARYQNREESRKIFILTRRCDDSTIARSVRAYVRRRTNVLLLCVTYLAVVELDAHLPVGEHVVAFVGDGSSGRKLVRLQWIARWEVWIYDFYVAHVVSKDYALTIWEGGSWAWCGSLRVHHLQDF